MKQIASFALVCLLAAAPATAQDESDGLSLMEEGARLLFRGLMQEMEPALDDLRKFSEEVEPGLRQMMQEMGPALADLIAKIDDFTAYHPPEILPNGDIIMRRKSPLEREQDKVEKGGEIDL
ncbi:hypothetical protein [Marimonas arenosa]|uniref:AAA+ family ATPase n=1 Tax=Marimonas arenosa TaxID=1795305 RepID=A0AAE3WB24_9RHOB|nr:hypothetical protein [Marimonas arenosa]MDQ2088333.1 hypothetical protein [Marimonas arenosa]